MSDRLAAIRGRLPRRRIERAMAILWIVLLVFTILAFAGLLNWWLALFIVTIPLLIIGSIAPTAVLYLTVAALPYLVVRVAAPRHVGPGVALAGAALAIGLGHAVPLLANRETQRRVDAIVALNVGDLRRLTPPRSVALLSNAGSRVSRSAALELNCDEDCQRLLFSGTADAVITGPPAAFSDPTVEVMRHEIVRAASGCDHRRLTSAWNDTVILKEKVRGPGVHLWSLLPAYFARGLCLRSTRARGVHAALVVSDDWGAFERSYRDADFRLHAIFPPRSRTLYRRVDGAWRLEARRAEFAYRMMSAPLAISPPSGADTWQDGRWSGTFRHGVGEYPGHLRDWLRYDDRLFEADGRPTPRALAAIDRAVERLRRVSATTQRNNCVPFATPPR